MSASSWVDRYSQPARAPPSRSCSSNPFQAMYARECSRPSSCTVESLPSSAPHVLSQSSGVVPHGLPLSSRPDTPLTPLCAHPYCKQYTSTLEWVVQCWCDVDYDVIFS